MSLYKYKSIGVKTWTRRSYRRCLCIICNILFVIILFLTIEIYEQQFEIDVDDDRERPGHCDQSIIRKFHMHNQKYVSQMIGSLSLTNTFSPEELFAQNPIRPSFTYELSNGNFCSSINPPHALVFVISKSINFDVRTAIRRTWGNFAHLNSIPKLAHLRLKLLFLLDIDEISLLSINLEQSIYHDIVQVHLPQHYILSTYRDMAILHWTETYCSNVSFTIKTDDDIFLNTFLLANALNCLTENVTLDQPSSDCRSASHSNPSAVIYGAHIRHARVLRSSTNPKSEETRYIITDDEYPCQFYPNYMSGFGYIITRHARVKLLCAFFRDEKLFHLSDVYITGILPEYLNIVRRSLPFRITALKTEDCETFFNDEKAFACASASHYREQLSTSPVDIFERFNLYWKRVYTNRLQSLDQFVKC